MLIRLQREGHTLLECSISLSHQAFKPENHADNTLRDEVSNGLWLHALADNMLCFGYLNKSVHPKIRHCASIYTVIL